MMARRVMGAGLLGAVTAACSPEGVFNQIALVRARPKRVEGVRFRPGPRGLLDIYAPKETSSALRPVVVFFYGGSWDSGERALYRFVGASLAAAGFVTVVADYRLYPEVRFPDFLHDNAEAVAWTRAHIAEQGGDPERIALMGHSAGAYNAMMLALDPQWLAAAGLPAHTVRAVVGLAGPYDFYPFKVASTRQTFGQWPDPEATQPIHFVSAAAPPVFVANGLSDVTVGPHNARNLSARLRQAGAHPVERYYQGVNHIDIITALSFPFEGKAPVRRDVTDFLKSQLD